MQDADIILSILKKQSENDKNFVFQRLYRNLFNQNFYKKAYANLCKQKAIKNKEIYDFCNEDILEIIKDIKNEKYYPKHIKTSNIFKNGQEFNFKNIPLFKDELVMEILKQILEVIYEPIFSKHTFHQKTRENYHKALLESKTISIDKDWVLCCNIHGDFYSFDHDILLKLLEKKICDGRLIELIKKFLKNNNIIFIPEQQPKDQDQNQNNSIHHILSNIYFLEFDLYIENLIQEYGEMDYIRFTDSWLIFSDKKESVNDISQKIRDFLRFKLNLPINLKKTSIVNLREENVLFLDYCLSKSVLRKHKPKDSVKLLIPKEIITKNLRPFVKNKKSIHHNKRVNLSIFNIIALYNSEIRNLYDYYCLASDVSAKLGKFKHFHYYSLAKTIAIKEKISVRKVIERYGIDVPLKHGTGTKKIIGIKYQAIDGEKILIYFNETLKQKQLN